MTKHPLIAAISLIGVLFAPVLAWAQRSPEAGYIFPAGGKAGTTIDVRLGGYNWTPDMEYFVSDARVKLAPAGPPGLILIPPPPYWFGAKGRISAMPLAKEVAAKLVIPADVPPGPIYWQAANANGATNPIAFVIAAEADVVEDESNTTRLPLADCPITASGRLLKNEEVDRYRFVASKDGPITCDLHARRLGAKFLGIMDVRDDSGYLFTDVLGSHAADPVLTFVAKAGKEYVVSIRDIDFAGDRSFVYRLTVTPGPRVLGSIPAAGRRGETREVEFVGIGIASGTEKFESVKRSVVFPAAGSLLEYRLETPWGHAPPLAIPLGDLPEAVAPQPFVQKTPLVVPGAITGVLDRLDAEDRYSVVWKKGDLWSLSLDAKAIGSPLDVALAIIGPDGKELARGVERAGTTDAVLDLVVPADGVYQIAVSDLAGKSGSRSARYRLTATRPAPDFTLHLGAPRASVPLGGKFDLAVKASRKGGFKGPIALTVRGLPDGISAPADLILPDGKNDLVIPLKAAIDAGTGASLVTAEGSATIGNATVKRAARASAAVHLITRDPDENQLSSFLVAATMKPRFKGRPVDQDTGRKVPRGSTFPAEVIVERFDGFNGEITLQMAAQQSYQVQGITGGDVVVPPGVERAIYPCYMPEWLESTRTSRMGIIAVSKVPDPKGKVRYLVSDIAGFVTMTMEGALLKISTDENDRTVPRGAAFEIRVKIARLTKLEEPVRIELVVPKELSGQLKSEPVMATVGRDTALLRVVPSPDLAGVRTLSIRATAMQDGKYPVISETTATVEFVAPGLDTLSFEKSVLPIFEAKCLRCHGDKKQKAMLDLRTKSAIIRGGENGPSLKPGSHMDSLLWEKIRTDQMPEGNVKLTAAEKDIIRRWIEAGAPGDDKAAATANGADLQIGDEDRKFWAFQTPVRPKVPPHNVTNPIDAFILDAHKKKGLSLSPEADRLVLLRRIHFDLIGLPPTQAEIDEFLKDCANSNRAAAYDKVVDRLLASPRYGERWGRHWLDLAGYADSEGILDADYERTAAWRYRDYVIRAFNQDKPYDRFLLEQIAGDELVDYWNVHQTRKELPAEVIDALVATGFLRCASDTSRPDFTSIKNAPGYYFQTLDDTLKIVASSTMGLTVQCAKCHSHKYDPIPQTDYYRMQAIFMSGYRPSQWVPQVQRKLHESTALQEKAANEANARLDAVIASLKKQQAELQSAFAAKLFAEGLAKLPAQIRDDVKSALSVDAAKRNEVQKYLAAKFEADLKPAAAVLAKKLDADSEYRPKQQELTGEIKKHESKRQTFPEIRAFYDLPGEVKTHLLRRGEYLLPGSEVSPGVLGVLANTKSFEIPHRPKDAKSSGRRLAFAQWLTRPDHPLTARVMVNRLWLHHFGQGLVATPDNFGKTGSPPSHPELLDWLATEFAARNWSIKSMHRLIVQSAAYKQQSVYQPLAHAAAKQVDPDNRLLWRQRLRRLEGEAMRDAVLAVSGTLNLQPFGPPVPMVRSADGEVNAPADATGNRRSIYLQVRRSQPLTFLQLFDQPVIETNCTRRETSTVASQALTLLNSDFMIRQADAMAERVLEEHPANPATGAILLAFARSPTENEAKLFAAFLDEQTRQHAKTQQPPEARRRAVADLCHMLLSANEFAYVD